MQNQLRINYRSGYWPVVILALLFCLYVACLSILNLKVLHLMLLLAAGFLLVIFELRQLNKTTIDVIRHDGKEWLADIDGKTIILQIYPHSFFSRFLLAPVFILPDTLSNTLPNTLLNIRFVGRKKLRLYFTAENCTESDFRYLSRLLVN